jgi:hypothetical protein
MEPNDSETLRPQAAASSRSRARSVPGTASIHRPRSNPSTVATPRRPPLGSSGERATASASDETIVVAFEDAHITGDLARKIAHHAVAVQRTGVRVVVVVAGTAELMPVGHGLAAQMARDPPPRELDLLLSAGEQVACALVAMAIAELGAESASLTGEQAGIATDARHGNASVREISPEAILARLSRGQIVVVGGRQGHHEDELTHLSAAAAATLAPALASGLQARLVEAGGGVSRGEDCRRAA